MTDQYLEEDINGQPSPLSLIAIPLVPPVAGGTDTEAIFWPSLAADAVIAGNGIAVAGDAAAGSIIQFSQPGLYAATLVTAVLIPPGGPGPINMLRGVAVPIVAPTYPSFDFLGAPGIEDLTFIEAGSPGAPENVAVRAIFRILNTDLVDPTGGINPNRQLRFALAALSIPGLNPPSTRFSINRVSR